MKNLRPYIALTLLLLLDLTFMVAAGVAFCSLASLGPWWLCLLLPLLPVVVWSGAALAFALTGLRLEAEEEAALATANSVVGPQRQPESIPDVKNVLPSRA